MTIRMAAIGMSVAATVALTASVHLFAGDEEAGSAPDVQHPRDGLPVYDNENRLLLPESYREWVFVGSSLGLTYSDEPPRSEKFSHVYVNPFGYREFRKTGRFPVGTMFLLETAEKGTKDNPALHGAFAKKFTGLEAAVKSGNRFDQPWTYYTYSGPDGKPGPRARRFTDESCISCHRQHAQTDHVFTQFYPVLTAEQ
jgi:hypothetical protein